MISRFNICFLSLLFKICPYEGISVSICLYLGTVHKYIFKFCFAKLRQL